LLCFYFWDICGSRVEFTDAQVRTWGWAFIPGPFWRAWCPLGLPFKFSESFEVVWAMRPPRAESQMHRTFSCFFVNPRTIRAFIGHIYRVGDLNFQMRVSREFLPVRDYHDHAADSRALGPGQGLSLSRLGMHTVRMSLDER
jgi:hypothetical protein